MQTDSPKTDVKPKDRLIVSVEEALDRTDECYQCSVVFVHARIANRLGIKRRRTYCTPKGKIYRVRRHWDDSPDVLFYGRWKLSAMTVGSTRVGYLEAFYIWAEEQGDGGLREIPGSTGRTTSLLNLK